MANTSPTVRIGVALGPPIAADRDESDHLAVDLGQEDATRRRTHRRWRDATSPSARIDVETVKEILRHDAGIGRLPGLDVDVGDAFAVVEGRWPYRDHVMFLSASRNRRQRVYAAGIAGCSGPRAAAFCRTVRIRSRDGLAVGGPGTPDRPGGDRVRRSAPDRCDQRPASSSGAGACGALPDRLGQRAAASALPAAV